MSYLSHLAWCWSFTLEEARDRAHMQRHLWTQAAACVGLAVLRRLGG